MEDWIRDLKLAARRLAGKPGATLLAVVSLALGLGFSTAAFSVVDAWLFRPLPLKDPSRLASVLARDTQQRLAPVNWAEYEAIASRVPSLEGVFAQTRRGPLVKLPDRDEFPLLAGVSDNYFDVLGVRASLGTVFHRGAGRDSTVVIADRFWRRALHGDPGILGRDLYFPFAQRPVTDPWFLLETGVDPGSVMAPVRETLRRVAPGLVASEMLTLEQHLRYARHSERMVSAVVGSLAGMGLLLAAAGLFGVTLYAVSRRKREFGIRAALGASSAGLTAEVVRGALKLTLWGIPPGWLLAWTLRETLKSFLYGVKPGEPWILAAAGSGVAMVAFLAALLPARRATRADPASALRYE